MKESYCFPCIIRYSNEEDLFYVHFPDIEEAFTDGKTFKEALYNAKDVLGLVLYEREQMGREIPKYEDKLIKTKENETVSLIEVWMPLVRDRIESKSIKKTLTIPKWLNDIAEKEQVNYSQLLQAALKNYLNV